MYIKYIDNKIKSVDSNRIDNKIKNRFKNKKSRDIITRTSN